MKWRNRIIGYEESVPPDQLLANPLNARRHPGNQREVFLASVRNVGFVAPVLVNRRTGFMVDGHLRCEEALSAGETVPVLYLDLSEREEAEVLATFDPIGALATYDKEVFVELLAVADIQSSVLGEMLAALVDFAPVDVPEFPEMSLDDVPKLDEGKLHVCPACEYAWRVDKDGKTSDA